MAYGRLPWIGDIWSPTHPGAVRGNARSTSNPCWIREM